MEIYFKKYEAKKYNVMIFSIYLRDKIYMTI